ncbi:MAG TPA: type II CAAX endopeptidase family protein [Verrucomicrobiae bacterium]
MLTDKTWKPEQLLRLLSGFLFCLGIGGVLSSLIQGEEAAKTDEGRFAGMVFFTVMLHGGGLLLVASFLRSHGLTWSQGFGFRDSPPFVAIISGIVVAVVFLPAAWMLGQVSAVMMELLGTKPETQQAVQMLQKTTLPMQQFFFGVMAVVMAPVVEEIFFRGVFYTAIKQTGYRRTALWGSSLLFALIHANVMTFLPLTVLALVLVWLYERTGNLLSCIAAHAFFNLVNFVLLINQPAIEQWLKGTQKALSGE